MPQESEARVALVERDVLIARVEAAVAAPLAALPRPIQEIVATCGPRPDAACACRVTAGALLRDRSEALEDDLLAVLRGTPVLGLEASLACPEGPEPLVRIAPSQAGRRHGGRDVREGVDAAGRRLGWGLYQTAWQSESGTFGDGGYHRGL